MFLNRNVSQDVHPGAKLHPDDLTKLLQSGFLIDTKMSRREFESTHGTVVAYVKLFTCIETRNEVQRRRVISWPRAINYAEHELMRTLEREHFKVVFYKASEVRDCGVKYDFAASLDFKKFYQQFQLICKKVWAVINNDHAYLLSTIPTGAVLPPLFAQALSRTLLAHAIAASNTQEYVVFDCCIDNLRLCSDNLHALWAAWNELLAACTRLNVTIGDIFPPPNVKQEPYTYLGMYFTFNSVPRVELAAKSKQRLHEAVEVLRQGNLLSNVDALALFGRTVWATIVTGTRLGYLYWVIKFIRRVQRRPLDGLVHVWPSIVPLWSTALHDMIDKTFEASPPTTASATIYTDASDSGWGVVILDYGDRPFRIFGGRWSETEALRHINNKELRALRIGIRILGQLKPPEEQLALHAFIDNTSAQSWALRKRAPVFEANAIALEMAEEQERFNIQVRTVDYVASAMNPADRPSRWY